MKFHTSCHRWNRFVLRYRFSYIYVYLTWVRSKFRISTRQTVFRVSPSCPFIYSTLAFPTNDVCVHVWMFRRKSAREKNPSPNNRWCIRSETNVSVFGDFRFGDFFDVLGRIDSFGTFNLSTSRPVIIGRFKKRSKRGWIVYLRISPAF